MMLGVNAYIFYKCRKRKGSHWKKWGPLYCTAIAAVLIMADLTRHVLADNHIWKAGPFPGSSQYRPGCDAQNITCLTVLGVFFTIIATYSGFVFLFIGTMWSANLIQKLKQIRQKWKKLREGKK